MSRRSYTQTLTAFVLAVALSGCAQMSGTIPGVSLKPKPTTATRFNVARLYERQKRLGAARTLYRELHEDSPQNLEVLHRLAAVSTRLGDFEQSAKYYEQSLAIDPDNSEVMADFGYSLYLQGKMETAEATLRKSLDLNPDNKRAVGNLALLVGMNGRIDESLLLYRQIVDEAEAQANIGYIYIQRGEGELAMQRYDRALTLDEGLQSAAMALVKLSELKDVPAGEGDSNELLWIADKAETIKGPKSPRREEPHLSAEFVRGQSFSRNAGKASIHSSRPINRQNAARPETAPIKAASKPHRGTSDGSTNGDQFTLPELIE